MSLLVSKPVLACSVVATALVYLGYLWLSHREEDREGREDSPPPASKPANKLQLDQIQEKLNCIKRSRLDTLEEEPPNQSDLGSAFVSEAQADTKDETATETVSEDRTNYTKAVFASTDIRYRNTTVETATEQSEKTLTEVCENKSIETVCETEEVIVETTVKEVIDFQEVAVASTETKMAVDETPHIISPSKIPDVLSALKDPICNTVTPPSPHSYSSSPVKSESSESKSSSCEWSDLIEQDEREIQEFQLDSKVLSSKLSGLELGVGGRSGDSGVASPSEEEREEKVEKRGGNKSRTQSGEDAGIGSEQGDESGACSDINYEETQLLAYHFHIPDYLCGKLIGHNGTFIKKLKEDCCVNIILKETVGEKLKKKKPKSKKDQKFGEGKLKLCCIEGTRLNIDKCLDIVKDKFYHNQEITFDQVNRSRGEGQNQMNLNGSVCLSLAEGVMHDVFVSSIVGGGHVFLQQPYHPTFFALERLDQCMTKTYTQFTCPQVPQPVQINSVCVAPCEGGWYRCQVVAYDSETGMCDIKYLDYGGYHSISATELKQIRTDFLSLPFQAIECYLANINPTDDENVSAFALEELVSQQVVQARMIGTNEQGVPMIHLYRAANGQTTMVNRELVDRSCAQWLETTIVKLESPLEHPSINWNTLGDFQNRNLGPNPCNQVNPIYFFPAEEMVQNSPGSDVLPFFDENVGFTTPLEYEYLNYSDCEEFFKAPVPDQPVLADFVPQFGP